MDTNYNNLLAKIKEKLQDLELILDIDKNNTELEQENIILINPKIYLAYDKIFCSSSCRNYFLSNI